MRVMSQDVWVRSAGLLFVMLLVGCERKVEETGGEEILRFKPEVGEEWVYEVRVTLDPSAQVPEGVVVMGTEGVKTSFRKTRRYLGMREPEEGVGEYHCFEVLKDGELSETEYALISEDGVFTKGVKEEGAELILMATPVKIVPTDVAPGEGWSLSLPDPNNPGGDPMMFRQFRYFGKETIVVLGKERKARRVQVEGRTGPLILQRDYWFVDGIGFVRERRSYYLPSKRVALMEEELVSHVQPE